MITVFRRYVQGTMFKVIIWVTICAIAGIFSLPIFFRASHQSQWALRVNGQEILFTEYMRQVQTKQEQINQFRAQYGQYADLLLASLGTQLDPKKLAFDELVKEELLSQAARKLDLQIHPEFITNTLNDPYLVGSFLSTVVPSYVVSERGIDQHALKMYLNRSGITIDEFEQQVERVLECAVVTHLVSGSVYVPSFDIQYQHMQSRASKKFFILTFDLDTFIRQEKKKEITDKEVREFFERQNAQTQRYWVPEKRSGRMWTFNSQDYPIDIKPEHIEQFYEKNKASLFVDTPTQVQVRRILFTVNNDDEKEEKKAMVSRVHKKIMEDPKQFSAIAQEVSEDTQTAAQGGLLPSFKKGEREYAFEKTAFLLPHDGTVSDVIETKAGFEILQRVNKTVHTFKSLEQVRSEIEDTLHKKKFSSTFTNDTKQLIRNAHIDEDKLSIFIQQKAGKAQVIDKRSKNDASTLSTTLFKIKEGEYAAYVEDNKGIIIALDTVDKRHVPSFESIENQVKEDIYTERAQQALKKQLDSAYTMAREGHREKIQKEFSSLWEYTMLLKNDDERSLKKLRENGVPVHQMMKLEKLGTMIRVINEDKGYLIALDYLEPGEQSTGELDNEPVDRSIESERKNMFFEGFVASLYRNATIETNDQLLFTA